MKRRSRCEWMPMLPWPIWPLAGHARLGQNVVVGSMTILLSWLCWGASQEEVCLDPCFLCNLTPPRFSVELPGRLLRHFSFSSSFPRGPNPGGPGHVKGALAHRAQRGLPWTWPRRDYIAPPEEEEKAPQQSAAACGCQGPATAMVPAAMAGGEGKEHAPAPGARPHTARPVKDRSTYPGSAATHEGC